MVDPDNDEREQLIEYLIKSYLDTHTKDEFQTPPPRDPLKESVLEIIQKLISGNTDRNNPCPPTPTV